MSSARNRQGLDGCGDLQEKAAEHQADLLLLDPIRVVPLVRHGPGISLHDDRQALDQRLADAAGARLADEKVGQFHIERNLAREALDPLLHDGTWPYLSRCF